MKVSESIRIAINNWEDNELEAAVLHACNAIDGTAKKIDSASGNKIRFTNLLRWGYPVLGPMSFNGINIEETRFPIKTLKPTTYDGKPDVADIIYGIHRCCHSHGDELPQGFELIRDIQMIPEQTRIRISEGSVQMSERLIFGLLAVAILSPVNVDQKVPDSYYLTFGKKPQYFINEWWGRFDDFVQDIEPLAAPKIKLDFGDWM